MGAGKTTIGKLLAKEMDYHFIDIDIEIEKQIGIKISDFFEEFGEELFRKIEREVLIKSINASGNAVIATGGGTPCFFDNAELMNANGETFFLNLEVEKIIENIKNNKLNERPLLRGKLDKESIGALLSKRKPKYFKAKNVVNITTQTTNEIIEEILSILKNIHY